MTQHGCLAAHLLGDGSKGIEIEYGEELTINVPLFKKMRDIIFFLRDNNFLSPLKMSREMAQKVIVPKKKIMSQIFLNSGTLVILCLFATMGPQFHSLIQAIIRKMQIFKCLI